MSREIGFNNFKAFGSKMQYFTKKPITLVYGPNSIGKSSLLHSQLYFEYYKQFKKDSNLFSSSFAGDELDIGGFENFIHKHNKNESITYQEICTNKEDIYKILGITDKTLIELLKNFFIDAEFDQLAIDEKLDSVYLDTGIEFKYFVKTKVLDSELSYKIISKPEKDDLNEAESQKSLLLKKAFDNSYLSSHTNFDAFVKSFEDISKKLNENSDIFEKAILATQENSAEHIYNTLLYFKYIASILKVDANVKLFLDENNQVLPIIDFNIDNEKVFTYSYIEDNWEINTAHKIVALAENLNRSFTEYEEIIDESFQYNYLHFSLKIIVATISQKKQIQYHGPLRHYPERWEMFHITKEITKQKKSKIELTKSLVLLRKSIKFFTKIREKYKSEKFMTNVLLVFFISVPQSLLVLFGVIFNTNIRKRMTNSDEKKDNWNEILPERFQLMRSDKLKSNEIWKKLIDSNETIEKLNEWLQDTNKLKSNYKIEINKESIYRDTLLNISLHRLFNLEKYFYTPKRYTKEQIVINKSIVKLFEKLHNCIAYIENKLNLKKIFRNQIKFIDKNNSTEVTPRDMGLGISQMLPILISTIGSKDTKIYLEQPELHLHPAVQMELMDEFIRSNNVNKNEFMMESHSEHMLLRVMKRMRQTSSGTLADQSLRLTPDDVCLLYVDRNGETTYIKELELDKDGTLLDPWPNGFFEEGYKERFE